MKKLLNISLSFLMIFTVAFATIETVDSEPAFANASKAFDCKASNGDLYGYQTAWSTGSSSIGITRFNVETGNTSNVNTFTKLGNIRTTKNNFQNLQASAMDDQGHLFILARKDNKLTPYYLASDSTKGVKVGKSLSANSTIDAATYFEYGGNKYMVAANGFFAGDVRGWTMADTYNYAGVPGTWSSVSFNVNATGVTAALPKTDDIAWLVDGSGYPALNGTYPSFVGYDIETQKVVLGYITSKSGNTFNITVKDYTLNRSGWNKSTRVGAVFAFGGSEVYAIHNGTGNVRKIKYDGSSFGWGSNLGNMTVTSNNDGAACHTGTPDQYWEPTASIVGTSTCDGEGKKLQVKLANQSLVGKNGAKAIHAATYSSTDGQSGTLYSFTQDIGSQVTYFPGPAFANGSVVTVNYTITNASDSTEVRSGTLTQTIDASECVTTPTDPSSTFSQSLGTCSGNTDSSTSTSTLSITNNESSATTYYKVEYSLDGGSSYTVKAANLSVAAGQTDTSMTQAVTHGQQIIWRVTDSDISNIFTGQSAEQVSASAVVGCLLEVNAGETYSACQTLGSASEGNHKTIMTFYNGESQTVLLYADIRLSTDGSTWGDWQSRGYQNAISANGSFTRSFGQVPDGQYYQWRWRFGTTVSNLDAASWIEGPVNGAVDCPTVIDPRFSHTLGACGAESPNTQRITLTPSNNGGNEETPAYFYVQIKLNGSDWMTLNGAGWDNLEVAAGATASPAYSVALSDEDTFDVRYAVQNHPHTETPTSWTDYSWQIGNLNAYTTELTIDCPSETIDTTVSVANGTCSGTTFGFMPQVFTMNNGSGADTVAYYRVQYNKNSAGWVTAVENQSVDINSSQTYTLEDLIVGDTIAWRYYALNSSLAIPANGVDPVSDSDYTTVSSPPTPGDGCNTAATSSSTSLGTCSGASVNSTLSIDINTYTDNFENGDNISTTPLKYYVQYQIDDGSWTDHTAESAAFGTGSGRDLVNATATFTQAVPDGSTINWRYQAKYDGGSFAAIADAPVISANDGEAVVCPYINPTASSAIGSCLQSVSGTNDGPATSTFTMQNAGATRNAYFFVEYKINDGDWIEKDTNKQVAADATETLTVDVPHGSTITWRYKSSITPRDFSTGSYTTLDESAAVNCPVLVVTATLTPTASCQDGVFTSFITIQNLDSSNVSGFIQAYYSFDNSTWTAATFSGADVTDLEIQDNTAKTLDGVVVPGGSTIYWRYEERLPGASFTNTYVTTGPNSTPLSVTADCPYLDPLITTSLGACNGTVAPATLTIDNTQSNMTGYFNVEYNFDGGAWVEAAANESVSGGQSTVFSVDIPTASTVQWRYKISDTSNSFTEDYITTVPSAEVDCLTILPGWTVSPGCRGEQSQAVLSYSNTGTETAFFSVWYQIDDGPFKGKGSDYFVMAGDTLTMDQDLEPGTTVRYIVKISDTPEEYTGSYQFTPYISVEDCSSTPTTTTTVVKTPPVFKPVIENTRVCNADGTANYLLKIDNSKSTVGLSITTLVKVGDSQIVNTTYTVPAGESRNIVTVSSVPEGTYYQIRFLVRDDIDGGTSKGVFKKLTDCIKDESTDVSTTTTVPDPTDPTAGCDTVFEGTCETPLTGEDGNDFFEWDEHDEEIFFTDGDYVVQYIYTEDELPIAATGIFQDLYVFYFVVLSSAGVVLLNWRPRRRKS